MIRLIKKIIEKSTFIPIFIKINKCLTFSAELMQLSVLPFVSVDCTHKRIHDLLKQFCLICYLYMYMLDMLSLHVHLWYVISTCTCLICNLYMYTCLSCLFSFNIVICSISLEWLIGCLIDRFIERYNTNAKLLNGSN